MSARDLDIVSYGATGFVGKQLAAYLDAHAPDTARLAIAGRDRSKLEAVARTLRRPTEVIVADAADGPALSALAARTCVVASTAGPYARYGSALVAACVDAGTHWCDITGETPWVAGVIARHHEAAARNAAKIVPFCGFDSIPSDLGAWLCAGALRERHGQGTMEVRSAFSLKGGLNGGTLASTLSFSEGEAAKQLEDPLLLAPEAWRNAERRARAAEVPEKGWDADLQAFVGPFFMGVVNGRVVLRSAALFDTLGEGYGASFRYRERVESRGRTLPLAMRFGIPAAMALLSTRPGRALAQRLGPAPGEGPSEEVLDRGFFRCRLIGEGDGGAKVRVTIADRGDPGNRATTKMMAESALALAFDRLPERAGVLTPAVALGDALVTRLRAAGMTIDITP